MKTEIKTITPEQASIYLESQINNRPLSPARVMRYATDMKAGDWRLTHQGLAFDENNHLIDGQHRLAAIVKADVSVQIMVSVGIDRESFIFLDTGGNRTAANWIAMKGYKPAVAKIIAAAIAYSVTYEKGQVLSSSLAKTVGNTNAYTLKYLSLNPGIAESAKKVYEIKSDKLLPNSMSVFAHFQIGKLRNNADEFIKALLTGFNLEEGSIIAELRRQLVLSRSGNRRLLKKAIAGRVIVTYNHWNKGTLLKSPHQALSRVEDGKDLFFR